MWFLLLLGVPLFSFLPCCPCSSRRLLCQPWLRYRLSRSAPSSQDKHPGMVEVLVGGWVRCCWTSVTQTQMEGHTHRHVVTHTNTHRYTHVQIDTNRKRLRSQAETQQKDAPQSTGQNLKISQPTSNLRKFKHSKLNIKLKVENLRCLACGVADRHRQPKNSWGQQRHRGPGPYKACNTKPQNASLPIHIANIGPSYCNTFSLSLVLSLS